MTILLEKLRKQTMMKILDYIGTTEVQNICKQLGLGDLTKPALDPITEDEVKLINS